jgi:putative Flp pilus-assembly TadE/G-like protein
MTNSCKSIPSFIEDKKGSVAPTLGIMLVPILAIMGGAIDIGQAISAKRDMQNALDASAVAVCGGGTGKQTSEEILRAYLAAQFEGARMQLGSSGSGDLDGNSAKHQVKLENPKINPSDGSVSPSLSTSVPTSILKLIGIDEIDVKVASSVKCGAKRLELSLVLDVTGSMNGSVRGKKKIDSLKDAGLDVLKIFERNMDAGVTRIALVPFAAAVNAGPYANKVRGKIKWGKSSTPGRSHLRFYDKYNRLRTWKHTTCVSEPTGSNAFKNTAPYCNGAWCSVRLGYVYTSNGSCTPKNVIRPLTADRNALRQDILSYKPSGTTAGHIGAAWGWYMLSNNWARIFPAASRPEAPNPDTLIKATIIMTDGEFNTEYSNGVENRYTRSGPNKGSSKSQFAKICEAMKDPDGDGDYDDDDSVIVYTVGFGLNPNGSTAQRLKKCATDKTKYFFPYDGKELRAAFVSIGKQLSGGQAGQALVQR